VNTGDLVHVITGRRSFGRVRLGRDEDDGPVTFLVESTDGTEAVIRYADDEVELTVLVADLIPVNPLS